MALKDIQIPKADVQVSANSSFAVRGLSTSDIEHLVRTHGQSLRELFNEFINGDAKAAKLSDFGPILKQLVTRVPTLVADLINLAADADEEDAKITPKLPVAVQAAALAAIAGMTLNTEGDMGKALETAIKLLGGMNGGLGEMLQGLAKS